MQFLLLSDSVALPRETPEKVDILSTWPYLLREKLSINVIQTSIGGATSSDLYKQTFYYDSSNFDIVIVQCGIVDLAPRAFLPFEIDLLSRFRITKYLLNKVRKSKRALNNLRDFRKVTYVSLKHFENNIKAFKKVYGDALYWITVPQQIDLYDKQVPGIVNNIGKYNKSISAILGENVIDISHFSAQEMMSDYHHLNENGHIKLVDKVIERLRQNNVIK